LNEKGSKYEAFGIINIFPSFPVSINLIDC